MTTVSMIDKGSKTITVTAALAISNAIRVLTTAGRITPMAVHARPYSRKALPARRTAKKL